MQTTFRTLIVAGLLIVPGRLPAQTPAREIPRSSGRVLVLEGDRVMEGEIERDGDRYRVRRPLGETWIPAQQVRQVCDSLDEVYRGMRSRTNVRDADELMKLARWCLHHGLREQALAEVNAVLQIRPQSAEAQRLQKTLQKPAAASGDKSTTAGSAAETMNLPTSFGLTLESLGVFSSKVQPILMNTCASCHGAAHTGPFKLARAYNDGTPNRRATQQNLVAVMSQINPEQWPSSPLMIKSISIHGGSAKPPLKGRQHPAYAVLEGWVQQVVADMPREAPAIAKVSTEPAPLSERTVFAATKMPAPPALKEKEPARTETPAANPQPAENPPPAGSVDPFDPALFNQQAGKNSK